MKKLIFAISFSALDDFICQPKPDEKNVLLLSNKNCRLAHKMTDENACSEFNSKAQKIVRATTGCLLTFFMAHNATLCVKASSYPTMVIFDNLYPKIIIRYCLWFCVYNFVLIDLLGSTIS